MIRKIISDLEAKGWSAEEIIEHLKAILQALKSKGWTGEEITALLVEILDEKNNG